MILVAIATVQLIAPGLGSTWFGADSAPESWTYAQRYTYLWTEFVPVLAFIVIGALFWWLGGQTRRQFRRPSRGYGSTAGATVILSMFGA